MSSVGLSLFFTAMVAAEDWPQWRGPQRDGQAAWRAPAIWPAELKQVWKVEVGAGHATPAVVGERVYVHSRQGDEETVRCLNLADGSELWSKRYPVPYKPDSAAEPHGLGPKSSPTVADGRLFTVSITGIPAAWDIKNGQRLWQLDVERDFNPTYPQFGASMSPLVHGESLIVDVGGAEGGMLAALDVASGRIRWRYKHADGPAYASPIAATLQGVKQYVTQTRGHMVSVSTAGKLLWSVPFETQYEQNSVTVLPMGELLICGGYQRSLLALRPRQQGSTWSVETAWENDGLPLYMSSPVALDGRIYAMSQRDSGRLVSLDPKSGKRLWSGKPRFGENASLVVAGKLLLTLNDEAQFVAFGQQRNEMVEVARYQVSASPTWAHLVPVEGGLLVKDETEIARWSLATSAKPRD
ncbi:MAG: PQQ-binding-like beta-propeller repeat protein [Pirellulales bacterium]